MFVVKEYDPTYAVSAFIKHAQKRYVSPGDMNWKVNEYTGKDLTIVAYEANGEILGPFAVERINEDYSRVSELIDPIGY